MKSTKKHFKILKNTAIVQQISRLTLPIWKRSAKRVKQLERRAVIGQKSRSARVPQRDGALLDLPMTHPNGTYVLT